MNSKIQQMRDLVITFAAIAVVVLWGYRELYPKEAQPDRIETTALALLKMQPQAFEDIAKAIDAGGLKQDADTIAKALHDAHTSTATDLANALKDGNYSSSTLRRAAAAQRKGMRN